MDSGNGFRIGDEVYFQNLNQTHKGTVTNIQRGRRTILHIQYWDNAHRGLTTKNGRNYNHGTRANIVLDAREVSKAI